MVELNVRASIADAFSELIQRSNYENLVLDLMNKSCKLFPDQYIHNNVQPRGECDFVNIQTGEKYDVKLAFTKQDGILLASRKRDIAAWIKRMSDQEAEFSKCISSQGIMDVEELTLYKTIAKLISKINPEEHAIFLIPYPIVLDMKDNIHLQFALDILSAIFNCLRNNNLLGSRNVYTIYPSIDYSIVIRNMKNHVREYIDYPKFEQFFSYHFTL